MIPTSRRRTLAAVVLLGLVAASPAFAQQLELNNPGELSAATEGTFPPFSMQTADGKLDGLEIRVMGEIAKRLGLTYKPVLIKWESLLVGLMADQYDVATAAMDITPERQKQVVFVDGWLESGGRLIVQKDGPIQKTEDIKGKRVGVLVASTWAKLAEGIGAEVKTYKAESDALQDLVNGNIDGVVTDAIAGAYAIQTSKLPVRMLEEYLSNVQKGFPVKPGKPALVSAMNIQEQVMQIAQEIGGYTLGAADLLRRAMGKKLPDEMAKHRQGFTSGAVERGLSSPKATQLFDLMEKFAGYGFNKSHAAAYALIAYQTAYLKAHHPTPFFAANLSMVMDDTDKVRHFRDNAIAMGFTVLPPDVNASNYRFEPVDATSIRYGLGGIKGTGQAAIEAIAAARTAGGPFKDLFEFCRRVDKRAVNRRAIEALIRAGAFDAIDPRRASLIASVGPAMDDAERAERAATQVSLFGNDAGGAASGHALTLVRDWSEGERLAHEKASLGYYLSGHPYHAVATELSRLVQQRLGALQPTTSPIRIAGVVAAIRTQSSRRGKMAFVTLDDGKDQAEIVVFNESFDAHRHLLREDALLVAEVKVMQRMERMGEEGQSPGLRIVADSIHDLAGARRKWARMLKLECNGGSSAERLITLIEPFRNGSCPVTVRYRNASSGGEIELGDAWRVNLDDHLLHGLRDWLKPENVEIVY